MDIVNHTVLAWLEEDNQKLGHFRVRPLLRETGPFTPAEIGEWRDDGFVRVVPDKSEQRSCKERLRGLGSFCLLTLTGGHTDKFKQNKNYAPSKGEKNRYIVYSNAVEAVPADLFYEVIAESMLSRAVTAQAYVRLGGKIRGPVDRQTGHDQKDARQLPPDDPRIFSVTLPDGSVRLFYWPLKEAPAAETPAESAAETAVEPEAPESEPMTALDQIKALDQQMMRMVKDAEDPQAAEKPQDVLIADDAGTPLYYAQVETEAPRQKRNTLAQAVESNRRAAKPEKKDEPEKKPEKKKNTRSQDQSKPAPVTAPAQAQPFADALKAEWNQADRKSLTAEILSLPGAREQFAQALGGSADPVLSALRAQLQDTEAERLMTVMNLNQAKAQEAQYRESLVAGLVNSERQALDELKSERDKVQEELKALGEQKAELVREQERFAGEAGLDVVCPATAQEDAPYMTVAHRVVESMRAAGFACELNDALSLLTVYAFCGAEGMKLDAQCEADGRDAAEALARALGGTAVKNAPGLRILRGGEAAVLLVHDQTWPLLPQPGRHTDVFIPGEDARAAALPVVRVAQSGLLPGYPADYPAVDAKALADKLEQARTPLNQAGLDIITRLMTLCAQQSVVIPLRLIRGLIAFCEAAQNYLEGGISAALDRGILIYAVPAILRSGHDAAFLSGLSPMLPLTRAALGLK